MHAYMHAFVYAGKKHFEYSGLLLANLSCLPLRIFQEELATRMVSHCRDVACGHVVGACVRLRCIVAVHLDGCEGNHRLCTPSNLPSSSNSPSLSFTSAKQEAGEAGASEAV